MATLLKFSNRRDNDGFNVTVPGGTAFSSDMCMIRGSWDQQTLQNGNKQVSFRVMVTSSSMESLGGAFRFFAAVNRWNDTQDPQDWYQVEQQLNTIILW